jgi:hypothetical protein
LPPEADRAAEASHPGAPGAAPTPIRGRRRVHCSYHKCLTSYFRRVLERVARAPLALRGGYRHFDSRLDLFERDVERHALASLNNHALDLDRFEDVRVTRFVRDPRDLVVSGYFYHRRGAEPWCELASPRDADWRVVNGTVPSRLAAGESFAGHLREVSLEDGLLAELEFRTRHFESMRRWPDADPRMLVVRYEDVLGHEMAVFDRLFRFLGLSPMARGIGAFHVRRLRASRRRERGDHIRDPRSGQWREVFTPAVTRRFERTWGDLLERLGYPDR